MTDMTSESSSHDLTDLASQSDLASRSDQYKDIILEYCFLALQESLTEADQDRMGEIYEMATEDSALSFWLEEGDHLVAHHLGLVDEEFIRQQQDKLRRAIGHSWIDSLWQDLQSTTKVLQAYLQRQGVYHGSIDGILGPSTQKAMRQLQQEQPHMLTDPGFTREIASWG